MRDAPPEPETGIESAGWKGHRRGTMTIPRIAIGSLVFLSFLGSSFAQAGTAGRTAYLNSALFFDNHIGIRKLIVINRTIEEEFMPRQQELQGMAQKVAALQEEAKQLEAAQPANPQGAAAKRREAETLQRQIDFKQKEARSQVAKRAQELRASTIQEIQREFREYAAARNIGMLWDVSKVGEALLYAGPDADVTTDFIAYYNQKHP